MAAFLNYFTKKNLNPKFSWYRNDQIKEKVKVSENVFSKILIKLNFLPVLKAWNQYHWTKSIFFEANLSNKPNLLFKNFEISQLEVTENFKSLFEFFLPEFPVILTKTKEDPVSKYSEK